MCCGRPVLDENPDRISETFAMRRGEKGRTEDSLLLNLIKNLMLSKTEKKRKEKWKTVHLRVRLNLPE
jgi:hypothetical protein